MNPVMSSGNVQQIDDRLKAEAIAHGFRVEAGVGPRAGKFWWALSLDGIDVEVSPIEYESEDVAWSDAILAYQDELNANY